MLYRHWSQSQHATNTQALQNAGLLPTSTFVPIFFIIIYYMIMMMIIVIVIAVILLLFFFFWGGFDHFKEIVNTEERIL